MPIKKIVSLKNVGRFRSLAAKGDVQFKRLTLVYGANGHGKTTLTGVLRSLATGDRAYVDERATLGVTEQPEAEILLDTGLARFSNGAWTATAADLEIFDTTFVSDNVFTGEHVGPEHRKNLYEVVVGASAVSLAREIDRVDAEGRRLATEITAAETVLRALIHAPFSLDTFVDLVPESDLTEKIRDCTTRLSAVRKQREILARPELDLLAAPALPAGLSTVLNKSVLQLSAETEERVRKHIHRLDHRGETWIRQGLSYVKADHVCPFCGQETSNADLLKLYRDFFSNAYSAHAVEIERASNLLEQTLGDHALGALQKRVLENDARIRGWSDLADLTFAAYQPERLEQIWKHVRAVLRERLQRKAANPSAAIPDDAELVAATQDYAAATAALADHNKSIAKANTTISDLKRQAAATKAETLEDELRRLRNMEIRQTPEAGDLITALRSKREAKKTLDTTKRSKKDELEAAATKVLETYQASINRLLRAFGANFTIVNTRPSFPGGKASSSYQLELNNTTLDIGDAHTPRGKPCFRTALSTGDKSTLALAFFLARLEQYDLSGRCVIVDDPLSSFDSFRSACTQQEVTSIAARAAQTIVLSHDAFFLKGVLDSSDRTGTACLQVVRDADSHALRAWDAADYFLREAHQEYFLLRSYLADGPPENGDLTSIARAIRPYLEGHLRHRFPDEFGPTEWLWDFVEKVRGAPTGSALAGLATKMVELEALNGYSKGVHHGSTTPVPRPTDAELQPWVRRALAFVQGE
jgi:wobble nucleotide-excising tRNase